MLLTERSPRPEKRRAAREILTLRETAHEDLLRGLPSNLDLAVARRACKNLWSWRNSFDVRRRGGGMFASPRRFNKSDAERAWQAMFGKQREHA